MTKKLFIHAGTHKTGTSSIQCFLDINRAELLKEGIHYPKVPDDAIVPYQHCHIIDILNDQEGLLKYFKEATSVSDKVLISSECFIQKDIFREQLSTLHKIFDEIMVIFYIRRQDEWVESNYHQQTRTGWRTNLKLHDWLEGFISGLPQFYYGFYWNELISKWSDVFGRDNILVRVYDFEKFNDGSIFSDFMRVLGIKDISAFKQLSNPWVNKSWKNRNVYELYRVLNMFLDKKQTDEHFSTIKAFIRPDPMSVISPEERQSIYKAVKEDNSRLEDIYFSGEACVYTIKMLESQIAWTPYKGLPDDLVQKTIGYFSDRPENHELLEYLCQYPKNST